MLTQMAKYLETVYVSGWQCSSTASSTDEPSPDLADYPMVRDYLQLSLPQLLIKPEYCSQQSPTAFLSSTFPRPQTARGANHDAEGESCSHCKHGLLKTYHCGR